MEKGNVFFGIDDYMALYLRTLKDWKNTVPEITSCRF
jgi:hypothetical protein